MTDVTTTGRARERRALLSGALTAGPAELVDFLLPLWAGVALGLDGTAVGTLLAVELALSVVARPLAGMLADVRDRRRLAALGALLYGVSCAGYAAADVTGVTGTAFGAAAVGGVGGAFLFVSVRAIVAERLAEDTGAFARLTAWQETGGWIAFVVALSFFEPLGHRGAFLGCAAACLVAAGVLLTAPRRTGSDGVEVHGATRLTLRSGLYRRLSPMLGAVVLTTAAEAAVGLMLLLHLQRGLGLDVVGTAFVFLPGAIAAGLAAAPAHRLVLRVGRRRVIGGASLASAAFAVSLAWAPNAVVVAVAWVLVGVAYAAVVPIEQAVVAEVAGDAEVGRGMGVHAAAALTGALVGSLVGGALYDTGSWAFACVVAAGALLAGAVVVPWAVARIGAVDVPVVTVDVPVVTVDVAALPTAAAVGVPAGPHDGHVDGGVDGGEAEGAVDGGVGREVDGRADDDDVGDDADHDVPKSPRRLVVELAQHAGLFVAVQVGLLLVGASWLGDLAVGDVQRVLNGDAGEREGVVAWLWGAGRIWALILVIDACWTFWKIARLRRGAGD